MASIKYKHDENVKKNTSAKTIVPFLIEVFNPSSVVDFGCGLGNFLSVFKEKGVANILGIDGEWINKRELLIPEDRFLYADLEKKVLLENRYDLALCLEVAEHISSSNADILIENITKAGDVIIFSAAVPGQGGQNHINEQPFVYWQNKFSKCGFVVYDIFRQQFWNNNSIDWWYKQNMFLIAHESVLFPEFINKFKVENDLLVYIHPERLTSLRAYMNDQNNHFLNNFIDGKEPVLHYLRGLSKKILRILKIL